LYFKLNLDKVFALLISLLIFVPSTVFGVVDIENQTILAESKEGDIVLFLDFGENQISNFNRIIPTLQSSSLVIGDRIVEIENGKTKIMGNSFVVHSENILIYAKGLGNNKFLINSYLLGGNQLDPIRLITVPIQPNVSSVIMNNSIPKEIIVLVQQDIRTFWNQNYDIEIKVFDKAINSKPQFFQSLGAINQAMIDVTLKDVEGVELTHFTGHTNSKGFWEGDYFVAQNLVSGGKYMVEVSVTYLESNNVQKFETLIVADTSNSKNSG
jgi:hypothetical protein